MTASRASCDGHQGTMIATSRKPTIMAANVKVLLVTKRLRPEEWGTAPGAFERGMPYSLGRQDRP